MRELMLNAAGGDLPWNIADSAVVDPSEAQVSRDHSGPLSLLGISKAGGGGVWFDTHKS